MKNTTKNVVIGALIAALYVGLTFASNIFGLAYGPIQFRVSEALTILPVFTPAAIPGLCVGCFLANIGSFNPVDMIFGTVATLSAALITYYARNVKFFGLPVISALAPVIINALVVGAEIVFFFIEGDASFIAFVISALEVGAGEVVTALVLGLVLYAAIKKNTKVYNLLSYRKYE